MHHKPSYVSTTQTCTINLLCHAWVRMPPWAGPRAQQPTAHSHSHSLSTAMAAAPAVALLVLLLLVVALLIIALLLLLPENTQRLSVEQREAWCGSLPTARRQVGATWVLPPTS